MVIHQPGGGRRRHSGSLSDRPSTVAGKSAARAAERQRSADRTAVRAARVTATGTVTAALIGVIAAVITASKPFSAPSAMPSPAPGPPSGPTVIARIENTGGPGVSTYSEPSTQGSVRFRGPVDGDFVIISCQRLDGQPMTDQEDRQPDQPVGWRVWDQLSDGRWLPDLYTDLPKSDASAPAAGLRRC